MPQTRTSLNEMTGDRHATEKLVEFIKLLDIDPFGNVTLRANGSEIVMTTQGDIQLKPARDLDIKSGRWAHINSKVEEIQAQMGRVIYGPRGEIQRTW